MKLLPLAIVLVVMAPMAHTEEGYVDAAADAASYGGTIIKETAGDVGNTLEDAGHSFAGTTGKAAEAVGGFFSDVGDGFEKNRAIASGDGVSLNASVYSLALRQAGKDNLPLKTLQDGRDDRQYKLKRALEETDRLKGLASDYKTDASNFQSNIADTLKGIAKDAKKLKGWDKAHQVKLDKLLEEHKKLGSLTAADGSARVGSHTMVSFKEAWVDLEDAIRKSPTSASKAGLGLRLGAMSSLLSGATERIQGKENEIMATTAKINEYSKVDEKSEANDEASMKRQMILGTLNNSVNNLINQAEFSKARSQLAFSHFGEIEKALNGKGLQAGDVKNQYKKNINALTTQYNNTPIGVYINSQISKAMGSVCDLVNNQCKEGLNASIFNYLDDSGRTQYKTQINDQKPMVNSSDSSAVKK
jgi:hypothetical protein